MSDDDRPPAPPRGTVLVRSGYASLFEHMGDVYAYHDLFGYVLRMSADVAALIEAFATPRVVDEVLSDAAIVADRDLAGEFVSVLVAHSCLVPVATDERDQVWDTWPFRGPWVLVHRPAPDRASLLTARLDAVSEETLAGWTLAFWDAADGERTVREVRDAIAEGLSPELRPDDDEVLATIARWVHHDRQYLRLSHHPGRTYRAPAFPAPPYLRSTMPYPERPPGAPAEPPLSARRVVSAASHYAGDRRRPMDRFDVDETTLSHLFRDPHPALGGRTYGEALLDVLAAAGAIGPAGGRVLEVGGGTGALAAGVIRAFAARWPDGVPRLSWTIIDLSPALREFQAAALADLPVRVRFVEGDAEVANPGEADHGGARFDLLLCNEVIGDLSALLLTRDEAADVLAGRAVEGVPAADADVLRRHPALLAPEDLPDEFRLNVGAFRLVEIAARRLAPGGTAWISEFGDEHRFPVLSDHLDHPEFSIHFGHLRRVAADEGFEVRYGEVPDLLGLRPGVEVLATTRGQFQALRALAARAGAKVEKVAHTRETLAAALGDRLPLAALEGLRWDRAGHRVMGLSPGDFKALLLRKPRAAPGAAVTGRRPIVKGAGSAGTPSRRRPRRGRSRPRTGPPIRPCRGSPGRC
ncbi:MAG: class I SAM-dependent methyltransferase [Deltaproteobacteria bacterium]|nr:class I SAM-dependent methyltransferase [Deltaproteobacteria bacterium]